MKKIYRTTLLFAASALALVGCNTDYNFDKLSLEVTVGDTAGIVVPLGNTGQIKLSELLEETPLTPNEDGYYSFSESDSFSYTVELGTLEPIKNILPAIEPQVFDFMGSINTTLPTLSDIHEIPLPAGITSGVEIPEALAGYSAPLTVGPSTFEQNFEVALPEQVASLGVITFGEDGQGSEAEVIFHLNNLADVTTGRTIEEFNIELPAGFTIESNDTVGSVSKGEGSTTNNRYTITNQTISSSEFRIGFIIKSLDMSSATITNGKANFDANVKYGFKFNSTTKAGYVSTTMPKVEVSVGLSIYSISVQTALWEEPINVEENINENVELPAEISRIDYLSVVDANNSAAKPVLNIALGLEDAPIAKMQLKNVKIVLPPFIDVDAPSGWTLGSDNSLSCSSIDINNNATNNLISLTIKGMKNINIADSKVVLDGKVGVNATAVLPQGETLSINAAAKSLKVTPTVTLSDIAIEEVTGLIDPDLGDLIEPQEIDLSEISEALGNNDIELNLTSPVLRLKIENPIGVGVDAVVKIIAYKGGAVSQIVVTPTLSIKGATGVTPAVTELILSGSSTLPDEPKYVYIEGLADIINSLPEKLTIELAAETNKDSAHRLVLQDSYTFNVEYSVDAALMFDSESEGHINYSTIIEDVDLSEIADVDIAIEKISLKVAAESTLPMDAQLAIEFLDGEENPIPGVKVASEGTIKGSTSTTATTSDITIGIDFTAEGSSSEPATIAALSQTKKLRCTFTGKTLAGGGLSPDQYLSANLTLLLDNGITVDLGSLEDDSTEDNQ